MKKTIPILMLVCMLVLIPIVSAMDWDNIKEYVPEEDRIDIYNSWIIPNVIKGEKLAEVKLVENTEYCIENCEAILEVKLLTDYDNIIPIFETYEIGNKKKVKKINSYRIRLRDEGTERMVDDYDWVCDEIQTGNGTIQTNCEWVEVGNHPEIKYKYNKYEGELLEAGTYYFKIAGTKDRDESVDWIASIMGIETTEWAVWTAGFNVGLKRYFSLDDNLGTTNVIDSTGNYNATSSANTDTYSSADSMFGRALSFDGTKFVNASLNSAITFEGDKGTVSLWIKSVDVGDTVFFSTADGGSSNHFYLRSYTATIGIYGGIGDATNRPGINQVSGAWQHVVMVADEGDWEIWINGTRTADDTYPSSIAQTAPIAMYIGTDYHGANGHTGIIDEVGVWNRSLSSVEIGDLWNSGNGIIYSALASSPTVELITPINDTNSTTTINDFTFNISFGGANDWVNYTFYIWNSTSAEISNRFVENGTVDDDCSETSHLGTAVEFECIGQDISIDDDYVWNVYGCNDDNLCDWEESNWTFLIDTIYPEVNITYPIGGSNITTFNESIATVLNFTLIETNPLECWYYNSTDNVTITCGTNASVVFPAGLNTIYFYANDTSGQESSTKTVFYKNVVNVTTTYETSVVEGESNLIVLNVNVTGNLDSLSGNVTYNNTLYALNVVNTSTYANLSVTVTAPEVSTTTELELIFNYSLNDIAYNFSTFNQTVYAASVSGGGSCAAGLDYARCWNFSNAQTLESIPVDVSWNFKYGITNSTANTEAGSLNATNVFCICINSTIYNNYSVGYGEIQYNNETMSDRRFYLFNNTKLTNDTINETLYSLVTGSSTSFLFQVQKGDLSDYEDVYLTLNRWYPDLDSYKVVEMAITDDKGETVMKVEVEDVDYRVGVYYQNGTLIHLASPFRLVCLASPCTYSLIVPEEAGTSFQDWINLDTSLTFDNDTKVFTLIYSDPSQATDTINLTVYREIGDSSVVICTDTTTGYAGVLTCNVSGYSGILRAVGTRTASPSTSFISRLVNVGGESLGGTNGLFLLFLIMVVLITIGIASPVLTVILSILAFIPALAFGIIPLAILLVITAMGFIVIHFMKRSVAS